MEHVTLEPSNKATRAMIPILIAVIAAMAPLTAATHGWVTRNRELALAERKHDADLRMGLLDRAIDPARSASERKLVFQLVREMAIDSGMRRWAEEGLRAIDQETIKLTVALRATEGELAVAREARRRAERLARQLGGRRGHDTGEAEARSLSDAADAATRAALKARAIKAALGGPPVSVDEVYEKPIGGVTP